MECVSIRPQKMVYRRPNQLLIITHCSKYYHRVRGVIVTIMDHGACRLGRHGSGAGPMMTIDDDAKIQQLHHSPFTIHHSIEIDPNHYKSIRFTTNRSDPLQIDPFHYKSVSLQIDPFHYKSIRFTTNRSVSLQIDPFHSKSIRFTTIRYKSTRFTTNRSDSIQIVPIRYKSIQFDTNRSNSLQIERSEPTPPQIECRQHEEHAISFRGPFHSIPQGNLEKISFHFHELWNFMQCIPDNINVMQFSFR